MTSIPLTCTHCGAPIGGPMVWLGNFVYHEECTRGPGLKQPTYAQLPPDPTPRIYGGLTEERVRQIVREELAALKDQP